MLYPVILCGGSGSRLWPLSTQQTPKQFLSFGNVHSLLQQTLLRLKGLPDVAPATLVTNQLHAELATLHAQDVQAPIRKLLLEPMGRNTAPAITLSALDIVEADPQGILLVLPSDHVIQDVAAFHRAVQAAQSLIRQKNWQKNWLVAFGMQPTRPHTGYGYIQRGPAIFEQQDTECLSELLGAELLRAFQIQQFHEKPTADRATEYLSFGTYTWNSGMFVFSAKGLLQALSVHAPSILEACQKVWQQAKNAAPNPSALKQLSFEPTLFAQIPSEPIDTALMEKTRQAAVIEVDIGWSDLGSWQSVWEASAKDTNGNVVLHQNGQNLQGHCDSLDNSLVLTHQQQVVLMGLKDTIVVSTPEALLILPMQSEQTLKALVHQHGLQ